MQDKDKRWKEKNVYANNLNKGYLDLQDNKLCHPEQYARTNNSTATKFCTSHSVID